MITLGYPRKYSHEECQRCPGGALKRPDAEPVQHFVTFFLTVPSASAATPSSLSRRRGAPRTPQLASDSLGLALTVTST